MARQWAFRWLLAVAALAIGMADSARAQFGGGGGGGQGGFGGGGGGGGQGGGGIVIDPNGVLRDSGKKESAQRIQPKLDAELAARADLRRLSLRELDAQIKQQIQANGKVSDDLEMLAGLYRIEYVAFDPSSRDIVLVGPAEGWLIAADGRAMARTAAWPTLRLQDLAIALRTVLAGEGHVACSIDPTQEGLAALRGMTVPAPKAGDRVQAQRMREEVSREIGLQVVTTDGVPLGSRFALAMIDADYRMKRLAMGGEKFNGLLSHFDTLVGMAKKGDQKFNLARWWFTAAYDPMLSNQDGTLFKLRGPAVMLNNEEVLVDRDGRRSPAGKPNPDWDKFCDSFNENFARMEKKIPAFADLHNLFDLMMAAGLVKQQDAGEWLSDSALLNNEIYVIAESSQPTRAEPVVNALNHRGPGKLCLTVAFGGVTIQPTEVLAANPPRVADEADKLALPAAAGEGKRWWVNLAADRPAR